MLLETMTPLGVHLSLEIMILSVEPWRWGHLYLVIMFLSIEPGRWWLFVSSINDSKCRNMVDGCHLSLAKGRRGSFDIRF